MVATPPGGGLHRLGRLDPLVWPPYEELIIIHLSASSAGCNCVNRGGPTSISQHNPQQFHGARTGGQIWGGRGMKWPVSMFKIEVFKALQMRFGPSKNTSLKTTFKTQPQFENEDITGNPQYGIITARNGVRWLILDSSHCIGNMYHTIHAQV